MPRQMPDNLYEACADELETSINESLSISSEVNHRFLMLKSMLLKSITRSNMQINDESNIRFKKGYVRNAFGEDVIIIEWELILYDSVEQSKSFKDTAILAKRSNIIFGSLITLHIPCIEGEVDFAKLDEVLQHELEHDFENSHYPQDKVYKGKQISHYARNVMTYRTNSDYDYSIGRILYLYNNYEHRAFCNGTYRYLMSKNNGFVLRVNLYESDQWQQYLDLTRSLDFLERSGEIADNITLKEIKELFNIDYKKLIDIGYEVRKSMIKYIGRAFVKAQEDFDKQCDDIYITTKYL